MSIKDAVFETEEVTNPVAVAKTSTAVALPTLGKMSIVGMMRDSFKNQGLDVDSSTFPILKLTNGNFMQDTNVLGEEIEIQLANFQEYVVVTPGDDKQQKLCRYSWDCQNVSDDQSIEEYIAELKEKGFDKAGKKVYLLLHGVLLHSTKPCPDLQDNLVGLQLAPTSYTNWKQYLINRNMKVSSGKINEDDQVEALRIKVKAKVTKQGTNTFTLATFQ